MKGPMVTQSLRGLNNAAPFHWRGDRPSFQVFNLAFDGLLGGTQLSAADMDVFTAAVNTIRYAPNPNQTLSRTMPATFANGDPYAGFLSFITPPLGLPLKTCSGCHSVTATSGIGSDLKFREVNELSEPQTFKTPQLRGLYMKTGFNNAPGADSINGFGFAHNGSETSVFTLLSHQAFYGLRAQDIVDKNNLEAYMLCFDTGTAPAVGYTRTLTQSNANDAGVNEDWSTMQTQAGKGNIDLIAKGFVDGRLMGLLYHPLTMDYHTDKTGVGPFTQAQLRTKVLAGGTLSVMGTVPGTGMRLGLDRNLDGILDGDAATNRARRADFDGDGRTDISVFRPANGTWYVLSSSGSGSGAYGWGSGSDQLAPEDFDGDGKTDLSVFRQGTWYVLRSQAGLLISQFGATGDIPQPGDYDGDGQADLCVWRPADGTWYIRRSRDGLVSVPFGKSGDQPVANDYDGDGKSDVAVYRQGTWYALRSQSGFTAVQFGAAGDKPAVGDYDGDGRADVCVWRPASGVWYYLRSSDDALRAVQFGIATDRPSPGDYDGDGLYDLAVFRSSDGDWYLIESSDNLLRVQHWGASQDVSVPGAFVP
jgi:hypothetical protein